MESLPVEVIGNILSQLKAARDVVVASATCRKWHEACRCHLRALSFDSSYWPDLTTSRLEILITQTIFQTRGLQSLSISMEDADEFSAAPMIAWLMYTKDTLRELCYNVRNHPNVNILERCGRKRLEVLSLAPTIITGVETSYQKFPCLRSLSLSRVSLSALDLSLLLLISPRIESLTLINAYIAMSDTQMTMELISPSLKDLHVEAISLDKLIVEADNLRKLHLRDFSLEAFEHIGKGRLMVFKMDDVSILHLDIGENTEDLEVVDARHFTVMWPKFYNIISKSSKLRTLCLWGFTPADQMEGMDSETISACFPRVSHLAFKYDLADSVLDHCLQGSSRMDNVLVLELGWTVLTNWFMVWVAGLLERCPNLKKPVINFKCLRSQRRGRVRHDREHAYCIDTSYEEIRAGGGPIQVRIVANPGETSKIRVLYHECEFFLAEHLGDDTLVRWIWISFSSFFHLYVYLKEDDVREERLSTQWKHRITNRCCIAFTLIA